MRAANRWSAYACYIYGHLSLQCSCIAWNLLHAFLSSCRKKTACAYTTWAAPAVIVRRKWVIAKTTSGRWGARNVIQQTGLGVIDFCRVCAASAMIITFTANPKTVNKAQQMRQEQFKNSPEQSAVSALGVADAQLFIKWMMLHVPFCLLIACWKKN